MNNLSLEQEQCLPTEYGSRGTDTYELLLCLEHQQTAPAAMAGVSAALQSLALLGT